MNDDLFLIDDELDEELFEKWDILIVDDELAIHAITKSALRDKVFDGKKLNFISAMSAEEAKQIISQPNEIALALIDVVMETPDAGLGLVTYIREKLNNKRIRLVLRTGQPSQAPEEDIVDLYDINDYKEKTELTAQKLYTLVRTSLKQYELICELEVEVEEVSSELGHQRHALDEHAIVAITNTKGAITYANEKFSEISGYSKEELIGSNHRIINSATHSKKFWVRMYRELTKGNVWKGKICNRNKNGILYWVDTTIVPFKGTDGKIKSYVAIRSDITKQVKSKRKMLEAIKIAEDAVVEKSEFLACMSHEIRTPMNGVIGMLALLKRTKLDELQTHQLSIAESSAHSLLTIVNDILDFSKIEAGKIELENIEFDLRQELGEIVESFALSAAKKNISMVLNLSKVKYAWIKSDPVRLRQIVSNILGNAIKFTEKGHIVINANLDSNKNGTTRLKLDIIDTGIGISEEKIEKLFDSFSQADSSTTRLYGGTGLGLSISKKLCALMNGNIKVSSELGKGSTFHIDLQVELSSELTIVEPKKSVSGKRALIVDCNSVNSIALKEQLEIWNIHTDSVSKEGDAKALIFQEAGFFDIIFVEMSFLNENNKDLFARIRNSQKMNRTKIVLMTDIQTEVELESLKRQGINAFVTKPITTESLLYALSLLDQNSNELIGQNSYELNEETLGDGIIWPENTKVLIVDDNKTNLLIAKAFLKTFNLESDISDNGLEAIELLKKESLISPYSLILMDCQMPLMSGYELTKEIRNANAGYSNIDIPIIAMTANVMQSDKDKCLSSGMNDHLAKPIDKELLLKKLKQWIKS